MPPQSSLKKPPLYKIVMLGDASVGKTSLVARLTNPRASLSLSVPATMGIEFETSVLGTSSGPVKAQLWDTAGQERFARVLLPTYFRKARGVVLVYDVTRVQTAESLRTRWITEMHEHGAAGIRGVVVANKGDLEGAEKEEAIAAGMKLAEEMGYAFFQVSAMTGSGVREAFTRLLEDVNDGEGANDAADGTDGTVELGKKKQAGSSFGCCS
mmetsp:Transcript_28350/g.56644  ORF Transcript_28350/g.56644 Transcript_28350/m.56644 type:complete len:212 (+) Transcript_28350:39-674(+)